MKDKAELVDQMLELKVLSRADVEEAIRRARLTD
jgi:hypothetical protein